MNKTRNVITDLEVSSYSINTLKKLLENANENTVVYEFHTIESSSNEKGLEIFREKNKDNYSNIIADFSIDCWSADISYAVRINEIWYFSLHSGANDYLGTGPSAVIEFRKFLKKKGIRIFAKEGLNEWLLQNFPEHPEISKFVSEKYFSYNELQIIRLLNKYKFEQTKIHFEEAIDNIRNKNWASVNGQLRTFFESLFCEIATLKAKQNCKTFSQAIKLLSKSTNPPFLKEELNEISSNKDDKSFLEGLWARLHPKGSHPGVPDIDDSIFRQQIIMLTTNYILKRLEKTVANNK